MRRFMFVLLPVAFLISFNAWSGSASGNAKNTASQKTKKCTFPKSKKRAPNWVCSAQDDSLSVAAVGSFAKSDAGFAFMEQMATADARTQLAKKLREAGEKKSADPDSAWASKITDESLQGTKVTKKAYAPNGRMYVLVGFDKSAMKKLREAVSTKAP